MEEYVKIKKIKNSINKKNYRALPTRRSTSTKVKKSEQRREEGQEKEDSEERKKSSVPPFAYATATAFSLFQHSVVKE